MAVERKPRGKKSAIDQQQDTDDQGDHQEIVQQTAAVATATGTSPTVPLVSLTTINTEQTNKRSKIYNAELFKLLELVNRNKDDFLAAVDKLEEYNYEKFSNFTHDFETKERESCEQKINLEKKYSELQKTLNEQYTELHKKLTEQYKEKTIEFEKKYANMTYDTEKKYRENTDKLNKTYEALNYDMEQARKKTADNIEREKNLDAYKFATDTLKSRNEIAIKTSDLADKNAKLESMTSRYETELKNLETRLTTDHKKTLVQELERKDLEHKSATAELTAKNKQQIEQVALLKETIETLKKELVEARNLTKSVAESGRQGQIVQNMGKN